MADTHARSIVNTLRDYFDDSLDQARELFIDRHPEIDIEMNLLDGNLEITETDSHFECVIPVRLKIAKA